jgi:transglutaminase-like putative cysteine protease
MSAKSQAVSPTLVHVDEGISTAILLYLLLFSVTGSIAAANWSDDLGILTFAAAGGITLGIGLAKIRRLPSIIAHLIAASLAVPATALFGASVLPGALTLHEKLIVLHDRVMVWLFKVLAGGPGTDAFIFVLQLTLMMWFIAYISAWYIYRHHQVWGAIIPAGLAIVINLFYAAPQAGLYIGVFLLSGMLLLVRLNLQSMEIRWRSDAVGYSPDISFDFLYYGAIATIILLFTIWLVPATAPDPSWLGFLEPLQTPWQTVEDQFNRMFSTLRGVARPGAFYTGSSLMLGGPVNLTQRPVMDAESLYNRYWRATVYDKYTGEGWLNTHTTALNLPANDPRLETHDFYRVEVTQTIKLFNNDQNILYAQSEPLRFDIPTEARYGKPATPDAIALDVSLMRARQNLRPGTTYKVVSAISVADEDSLRADTVNYSNWITSTYLQLPNTLPQRVRDLAASVTRGFSNPYDKATALEKFVRNRIKYNEAVPAPPADRDGVDYTLFDRPEGYCNYYASAMAVMARAVGIPARVVSGFALGTYDNGVYHIVEANSHAWVEVYFPSYGWIEFEPTANKPELERPKRPSSSAPENPDAANAAEEARRRAQRDREGQVENQELGNGNLPFNLNRDQNTLLIGGALGFILISAFVFVVMRQTRPRRQLAPAARVYEQMLARAVWLGIREQNFATPLERAQLISAALPNAQSETERIASAYTRERFGAHTLDEAEQTQLTDVWHRWDAAWRSAITMQVINKLITPPRNLLANIHRTIERWGTQVD